MATKKNQNQDTLTLSDLLALKLKSLLDVEQQLVKALPKMTKHASDADLKAGFEEHTEQTRHHVERLERALDIIGVKPQKLQGEAIRGLVDDAEWVMKHVKGEESLDANLISAAEYVEHYEIAGYESAISWARLLGQSEVAELMEQTLNEEQEAAEKLSILAESKINERAASAVPEEVEVGG